MPTDQAARVFTAADSEPECRAGTIAVIWYGDYRHQQAFVRSGASTGNWYPLGNEFGKIRTVDDERPYVERTFGSERWQQPGGTVPTHPTWYDLTRLGPVTILVPADNAAYRLGWADGRRRLSEQFDELRDQEDGPDV
jgi:hypothetical protein